MRDFVMTHTKMFLDRVLNMLCYFLCCFFNDTLFLKHCEEFFITTSERDAFYGKKELAFLVRLYTELWEWLFISDNRFEEYHMNILVEVGHCWSECSKLHFKFQLVDIGLVGFYDNYYCCCHYSFGFTFTFTLTVSRKQNSISLGASH